VIAGPNIPDIPECVDKDSFHVHAPTLVAFICGGVMEKEPAPPRSLRDAFMRVIHRSPLKKYQFILAEDPGIFVPQGEYFELLKFESDIAQLSELLVLFSESYGSVAELGVFVMDDEISPKLMVVIDEKNYAQDSFIRLGPLFSLSRWHGESAVCVLTLSELNAAPNVANIELDKLLEALDTPLKSRLAYKREPRTFDKRRHGHVTKLITGLIQHYGALTLDEIDFLLYCLNISTPPEEIKKHLLCAKLFQWVYVEKRGIFTYYAATLAAEKNALQFNLIPNTQIKDRKRWRADIRDYWQRTEPDRFKVIQRAMRV
jgi:hypothetical protein